MHCTKLHKASLSILSLVFHLNLYKDNAVESENLPIMVFSLFYLMGPTRNPNELLRQLWKQNILLGLLILLKSDFNSFCSDCVRYHMMRVFYFYLFLFFLIKCWHLAWVVRRLNSWNDQSIVCRLTLCSS